MSGEPDYNAHIAVLLSGAVTCRCGWESGHFPLASDAEAAYDQHLRENGIKP